MKIPVQLKTNENIALFKLLPESFISPIEAKDDIPHHSGTDFHKGLEYVLEPHHSQFYAEHIGGKGAIEIQYTGTFVNKKVKGKWTLIKPLKHHTDKDIGHTGGVNMVLKPENNSDDIDYNYDAQLETIKYNKEQILRVVDILREIGVIYIP